MRVKAKFSNETKKAIYERDKYTCIVKECTNHWIDPHHVYFWLQAKPDKNRNNVNKWVTICRDCHNKCHACKSWQWIRQETINYLKQFG